ncbi:MAG: hypothetical protein IPH20_22060 [Bacteroidales bacterium]|nr:hypothetical protein [Bacteroidales bacterium]
MENEEKKIVSGLQIMHGFVRCRHQEACTRQGGPDLLKIKAGFTADTAIRFNVAK